MTCVLSQLKLPFTHDPAVGSAHSVHVRRQRGCLGSEQRVHHGSAAEGPDDFPQGELILPRRVIKMEVCFDKDTLGHFFPTALARVRLFRDASRKPDMLLKTEKGQVWRVHLFSALAIPVTWFSICHDKVLVHTPSYQAMIVCIGKMWPWNRRCLFCRSQLPVHFSGVNMCVRVWCETVCVRPLSSHTMLWCGVSHKLYSVCLHAPFVVFSTVWCCLWCVDFLSCFVICVIGLFLHVFCPLSLLLVLVLIHSWLWFTSFLCSLIFPAVSLVGEVSLCAVCLFPIVVTLVVLLHLVRGCGGLLFHWCITILHPHKARKFPRTGSRSFPAACEEAFWTYFSLLLD